MERVVAQLDGSSLGNPGPAGAACILRTAAGALIAEHHRALGVRTNNQAEYEALLLALRAARTLGARALVCRTDSELLYYQMTGRYRVRNPRIRALARTAQRLVRGFTRVEFELVPRTANRAADRLARTAARS